MNQRNKGVPPNLAESYLEAETPRPEHRRVELGKSARTRMGRDLTPRRGLRVQGLFLFLLLFVSGCENSGSRYTFFSAHKINGKTVLLLENGPALPSPESSFFSIYMSDGPDYMQWSEKISDRQGPVVGTYIYKGSGGDVLGVLHQKRVSLFRFDDQEQKPSYYTLPFDWTAETGTQLNGKLYVFGGVFSEDAQPRSKKPRKGRIGVGSFDGTEFKTETIEGLPDFETGQYGLFWLKSVKFQNKIHLFWRGVSGPFGMDIEPQMNLKGPVKSVTFDGKTFGPVTTISELPPGFIDVWSDGDRLRMVVQPQEPTFGRTPPLGLFTISADGKAVEERIPYEKRPIQVRMKFYGIIRLPSEQGDVFLRTNSQSFEIWRATPKGWNIDPRPRGLPENSFESFLLTLLGMCVLMVASGIGLAYRRRKHIQVLLRRLKPSDVVAPLSLRISAYLIDLLLIGVGTEVVTRLLGIATAGLLERLVSNEPARPFFILYMVYFPLLEWAFGATLGKWVLGLRVVTSKGKRLTIWAALVRNLIGIFERNPLLAGLTAFPTIILTPRNQRLGDLLALTIVVQKTAMDRFFEERADSMVLEDAYGQPDGTATNSEDPDLVGSEESDSKPDTSSEKSDDA